MSDYYDDYDDNDDGPEIKETCLFVYLCKAENGQLYAVQSFGWCYWGQDWGETVGQWTEERLSYSETRDEFRKATLDIGKALKAGEFRDVSNWPYWLPDED